MPNASKFLSGMLGADYHLLLASGSVNAVRRFNVASFLMILIWMLTFLSVYHAMDLLFHSWYMQWGLAIFLASLLILMYVFLINTFTRESFKKAKELSFSNGSRIGFVLFMAFVLSKPLEIWINEAHFETQVSAYRVSLVNALSGRLNDLYDNDQQKLARRAAYLSREAGLLRSDSENVELAEINRQLDDIRRRKELTLLNAAARVDKSPFFLYQVRCATGSVRAWVLCLGIIALFILPGYLVYTIPPGDPYMMAKAQQERTVIKAAFSKFLEDYLNVFARQKLPVREYSSVWQDPPFNTLRKDQAEIADQEDFLERWGPFS